MSNNDDSGHAVAPTNLSRTREWSWPIFWLTAAVVAMVGLALIDKITSLKIPIIADLLDVMDKVTSNLGLIIAVLALFLAGAITWRSRKSDSRPLNVRRPVLRGATAGLAAVTMLSITMWMIPATAARNPEPDSLAASSDVRGWPGSPDRNSAPSSTAPSPRSIRLLREHDVMIEMRPAVPPQGNLDPLTGDLAEEGDPYAVTFECKQQGQKNSSCVHGKTPAFWMDPIDEQGAVGAMVGDDNVDDSNACLPSEAASRRIHEGLTYCIKTHTWTAFIRIDDLPEKITENDRYPANIVLTAHVTVWAN